MGAPEAQALLKVLSSRWLLDQLASLPGYDPARRGEHIAALAPARTRRSQGQVRYSTVRLAVVRARPLVIQAMLKLGNGPVHQRVRGGGHASVR